MSKYVEQIQLSLHLDGSFVESAGSVLSASWLISRAHVWGPGVSARHDGSERSATHAAHTHIQYRQLSTGENNHPQLSQHMQRAWGLLDDILVAYHIRCHSNCLLSSHHNYIRPQPGPWKTSKKLLWGMEIER